MENTAREIYKNSLIKGLYNKYTAEKESLMAEMTLLLEGNGTNPVDASDVFKQKINRLAHVEGNLTQMEVMFMGQQKQKECCDEDGSCDKKD